MNSKAEKVNKLIVKISNGNLDALDELFEEVGGLLMLMAKKYLIDNTLAEDLVSEIFVRLVKSSKSFNARKNGLNWLFKSVRNEAINWNKKSNPYFVQNIDEQKNLAGVLTLFDDVTNKIVLADALKTLSETENTVLYYKFWQGLTVRDIARIIKKPRSTTQDIISTALCKLEKLLN